MKKFIYTALMLIGALSASSQHYIGVKGGYGAAWGRFYTDQGTPESAMIWNRYTGGVVWRYFSPQQVFGGVSAEIEFQMRGYRIYDRGNPGNIAVVISDTTSYRAKTRTVSSVTVPLIWHPHFYIINRSVRVYGSLGVTFTYNLGAGDTHTVTDYAPNKVWEDEEETKYHWGPQTVTSETTPYKMQTARDVRWNYGWLGGVGIGVLTGPWEIFAEGRYYYGMSDILRTKTKYQFNEEGSIRSELDNIYITMGITFRLGKGGILAPPLRKRRAVPAGGDDFRNIKQ